MISPELTFKVPFWAVELVGIVALMAIDFLMAYVYEVLKKKVSTALRKRLKTENVEEDEEEENPFDYDENAVFDHDEVKTNDGVNATDSTPEVKVDDNKDDDEDFFK